MYREINANFINTFDLLLINRRKRRKETKSDGSKLNLIVRKKRKGGKRGSSLLHPLLIFISIHRNANEFSLYKSDTAKRQGFVD